MRSGRLGLIVFSVACGAQEAGTEPTTTGAETSSTSVSTSQDPTETGSTLPGTDGPSTTSADTSTTGAASEATASTASTESTASTASSSGDTGEPLGHVLYLNFDGVVLTEGGDNATTNSVWAESFAGEYAALEHPALREALVAEMEARWGALPITLSLTRPNHDDYSMLVITGNDSSGGIGGAARASDCADQLPNSVGIVWPAAYLDGSSVPPPDEDISLSDVQTIANTASAIGGLLYGLEIVEDGAGTREVMWASPSMPPLDRAFEDACLPILAETPSCQLTHAQHCPPGEQNSWAELSAALLR
jgi:hypothetical protein